MFRLQWKPISELLDLTTCQENTHILHTDNQIIFSRNFTSYKAFSGKKGKPLLNRDNLLVSGLRTHLTELLQAHLDNDVITVPITTLFLTTVSFLPLQEKQMNFQAFPKSPSRFYSSLIFIISGTVWIWILSMLKMSLNMNLISGQFAERHLC